MGFDIAEEVRWTAASATAAMGRDHAPLGAGVGSFVAWFDQAAPEALIAGAYCNHAHNEYSQWWLESGLPGLLAIACVLALLLACHPGRPAPAGGHGVAVAAWLGCLMLLHSWVDYPLLTAALMAVAGLLAGIVVAQRTARALRTCDTVCNATIAPARIMRGLPAAHGRKSHGSPHHDRRF